MENILERCTHVQLLDGSVVDMTEKACDALLAKLNGLSAKALRCLGLAYKDDLQELSDYDGETHPGHATLLDTSNYDKVENNLVFVGMAGLRVRTTLWSFILWYFKPFLTGESLCTEAIRLLLWAFGGHL